MISKKLATSLGAGALGAGGAAAAAALNMGNKSQNEDSQSLVVEPPKPSLGVEVQQSDQRVETQGQTHENQRGESGSRGGQTTSYFDGASVSDNWAVGSKNWKTEATKTGEVTIKIEEDGNSWQCTVRGAIFNNSETKNQSISDQVKEFVKKMEGDEGKRKRFVENCSKTRLTKEKEGGKVSTIELEMDENTGKLKNLDDLLEKEFLGLKRVEEEYQGVLDFKEGFINFDPQEKGDGKILLSIKVGNLSCTISGKIEDSDFKKNDFNFDALNRIFMSETDRDADGNVNDEYTKEEKKKFLIRNCSDNNGAIEGMKVVSYMHEFVGSDFSMKKWKFENLDEILTKMYTNPENKEAEKSDLSPPR